MYLGITTPVSNKGITPVIKPKPQQTGMMAVN